LRDLELHSIERLKCPAVLEMLASHATSGLGQSLCRSLRPSHHQDDVRSLLEETGEARELLGGHGRIPLGGIHDLTDVLRRAEKGSLLSPDDLLLVADCLRATRALAAFLRKRRERAPRLAGWGDQLVPVKDLEDEIGRCVTENGEVADSASPELSRLRRQIRREEARLRERLEQYISSSETRTYLQEPLVTMRGDRFVLPVKQEHRNRVPGIVHDQSKTGSTLFIEPMAAVELNNELKNLQVQERHEVERLLYQLGDQVGRRATVLAGNQSVLAQLDLIFARGRMAESLQAVHPVVNSRGYVRLKGARHPLLGSAAVPIDLEVGGEFRGLVITGPNTGGKTVTLQTVGLLVLMAEMGLHLPAEEGTEIALFDRVLCDIGDEQSIEQNLSTFSSHMRNVIPIVEESGPGTLVLLDEVGAGTDPMEGAPLAMSVLEDLYNSGCVVVATTHYSQLKAYAYQHKGINNASMEFDADTLEPTYRVIMGLPGRSNALAVSRRLGMPERVLERARGLISSDMARVEELITAMQEEGRALQHQRVLAERETREITQLKERLQREREDLARARRQLQAEAQGEAVRIVDEARKEARDILAAMRSHLRRLRDLSDAAPGPGEKDNDPWDWPARAERARNALGELARRKNEELARVVPDDNEDQSPCRATTHLQEGDYVRISSLGKVGRLLSTPDADDRALVQVGVMKIQVDLNDLTPAQDPEEGRTEVALGRMAREKQESLGPEIHLLGCTVEEALARLDKYLDDAILAGRKSIRVVHGKGTGALRRAVREFLTENPRVVSLRPGDPSEGGEGVTLAVLQQ